MPSHLPQTFNDGFIKNKKCDARNVDKHLKRKTNILSSFIGVSMPVKEAPDRHSDNAVGLTNEADALVASHSLLVLLAHSIFNP